VSGPPLTGVGWALAAVPVVVLFATVVGGRLSTSRAAALVLAVTGVVAATAYRADPAVLAVALGKGLWLGAWILGVVWPALLLYRVASAGGLDRIGGAFGAALPRREETLLLLAWVLPAFVQGVAGFGTPIAVAAPLLLAAGWSPQRAVLYPLVGYHWAVTFGSMGSSFYMASLTAGLDVAGQSRFALAAAGVLALNAVVAGALVLLLDGGLPALRRGGRMLAVVGLPMAATLVGTAVVVPAVATLAAGAVGLTAVLGLSLAQRRHPVVMAAVAAPLLPSGEAAPAPPRPRDALQVLAPYGYLLVTALPVFLLPASRDWVHDHLVVAPSFAATSTGLGWDNPAVAGYTPAALFGHPGTYIALAAVLGAATYRLAGLWPRERTGVLRKWARSLPAASLPVLLLACVATTMADSGMVSVLARGVATVTAGAYPAIAPLVGGIGSFLTGSTTTSNALFAGFQRDVAGLLQLDPTVLLAAQTAGGNVGNALSPVVVLIGASALGRPGEVSAIARRCVLPAAVLLAVVATVTLLRSVA